MLRPFIAGILTICIILTGCYGLWLLAEMQSRYMVANGMCSPMSNRANNFSDPIPLPGDPNYHCYQWFPPTVILFDIMLLVLAFAIPIVLIGIPVQIGNSVLKGFKR